MSAASATLRSVIDNESFGDLSDLRDVLRLLPAGVTVLDEHGNFLLANDAAADLLGFTGSVAPAAMLPEGIERRRCLAADLIRASAPTVCEERFSNRSDRVLLTTHRPIMIRGRQLLVSSSVDLTQQKAVEDELFRRAYFDELTGLPNRAVIERRVEDLLIDPAPQRFALAFLDVDSFKQINDYYGHAVGDALLVEIAKRLSAQLRPSDTLSRISGDEFLLLLNPVGGPLRFRHSSISCWNG